MRLLALLVLVHSTTAVAQPAALDTAIGVQLFERHSGPKTFLVTADGAIAPKKQLAADLTVTFLANPFTVFNVDEMDNVLGTRTNVIETLLAAEISVSYGLTDRLQLGLILPGVLNMTGEGINPSTGMPTAEGLTIRGMGDVRVEGKIGLMTEGAFRLASILQVGVPSSVGSNDGAFLGDNLPYGHIKAAASYSAGSFVVGGNIGGIIRKPREILGGEISHQLTFGAAVAYRAHSRVALVADVFGRSDFGFNGDAAPMEADAAVRVYPTSSIYITGGGGIGILQGIGSPKWRAFVDLGFAPDTRDPDGDGISNRTDRCPNQKEDKDGYNDSDGCPDDDNDSDRRLDAEDKCPNEAEDFDGFEDEDGCPELDNDGDGIEDLKDQCPMDKEDGKGISKKDGCPIHKSDTDGDMLMDDVDKCPGKTEDLDEFEDWDGCPDDDNDKDGVPDSDDRCPLCPEDKDNTRDDDGCPDPDNDGDGINDVDDKCPLEAEDINGISDNDGCPDGGGAQIATFDGQRINFSTDPSFNRRGNPTRAGTMILTQAAATMRTNPQVSEWAIVIVDRSTSVGKRKARSVLGILKDARVDLSKVRVLNSKGSATLAIAARGTSELDPEAPENVCTEANSVTPRPEPPKPDPVTTENATEPSEEDADDSEAASATSRSSADDKPAALKELPSDFKPYQGVSSKIGYKRNRSTLYKGTSEVSEIAELLKKYPSVMVEIGAHTDSRRSAKKSLKITQGQADDLAKRLTKLGVKKSQIKAVGYGRDKPVASNKKSSGRAANRRIELRFYLP